MEERTKEEGNRDVNRVKRRCFYTRQDPGIKADFNILNCDKVTKRGSLLLPSLKDEERIFHELVFKGNVETVASFLEKHPNFNINCSNFQGVSGLHIAVHTSNEEMVELLLNHPNIEVGDTALHAIRANQIEILQLLLDKQESSYPGLEFAPCFDSAEFADNITPLMLAAGCGHYEIVTLLLDRGHEIPRPHHPRCFCQAECQYLLRTQDALNAASGKFQIYKALSNPVYICQTSDDPILVAFRLSLELREASIVHNIFHKDYEELATHTRNFSANIIEECRSSEEVETILKETRGSQITKGTIMYPRLILAIDHQQTEFVSRPNVQQVLEASWMGEWYAWRGLTRCQKAISVIPRMFLLPVVVLALILMPRSAFARHHALPINKMLNSVASYIFFLICVFLHSSRSKKLPRDTRPTVIQYILILYVMAYVANTIRMIRMQGMTHFVKFAWNIYDMVMELVFLTTICFWITTWVMLSLDNVNLELELERKYWHYLDPTLVSEGLFVIATIMAYMRILLICQLNYDIGPFQVSLMKMSHDCAKFSIMLGVIILAFTAGLCKFYSYYENMKQRDPVTGIETLQEQSWVCLLDTFKTLFWGLFGIASQTVSDVIIEYPGEDVAPPPPYGHRFTEGVGYVAFAAYMMLAVLVILNMLIASMSNTFHKVTGNIETEWVFGRTEVYLQYINQAPLPAPFNLLPIPDCPSSCFEPKCKRKDLERGRMGASQEEDFHQLMSQLVQRYFSNRMKSC